MAAGRMQDFVCEGCQHHFEKFFRTQDSIPDVLECESCGEWLAKLTYEPSIALRRLSSWAQSFTPVVIHKSADGQLRFPAHADAPVPEGYQKVTLTNLPSIRRLEKEVNDRESAAIREQRYHERGQFQAAKKVQREAFLEMVRKMSPKGRAFAERAMEYTDQRRSKRDSPGEANFHLEAFSMDGSNREAYRDAMSDWRRARK